MSAESRAEQDQASEDASNQRGRRLRPVRPRTDTPEGSRRPEPWRPNFSVLDDPDAFGYKVFTRAFDEIVGAEELCDADELERLARLSRQAVAGAARRRGAARQPAAAPPAGAAEPRLGFRSRRRHDRRRAACPRHRRSRCIRSSFKQERETEFRDTVVTLLLDNSGSMRGRPDHGRRLLGRYSCTHA